MTCYKINAIVHKIILMRHAESVKNIKKIHGGKGESLTEYGKAQAIKVAKSSSSELNTADFKGFTSATSCLDSLVDRCFSPDCPFPNIWQPLPK